MNPFGFVFSLKRSFEKYNDRLIIFLLVKSKFECLMKNLFEEFIGKRKLKLAR
jgi:hypothetical protein